MDKCIFCMIVNKEIPSKIIYEDEHILAFEDINPQAPVHVVVISKNHLKNISELTEYSKQNGSSLIDSMIKVCVEVAKIKGIKETGFRIINNCGEDGGQTVMHVHFHVLGGTVLGEKM